MTQDVGDEDLYDEVDEDTYKSIVRGRLQEDDFIEDDDGGGYADNGMDDYGDGTNAHDAMDEDEDDRPSIGRRPLQTAISMSRLPVPSTEEILQNLVKQKNLIPIMDALIRLVAGSALSPPPPAPTNLSLV